MKKIIIASLAVLLTCTFVPQAFAEESMPKATSSKTTLQTPAQIEVQVREYFTDIPVMIDIAKCESGFRQFTDAGNVFYGGSGRQMVGVYQFYESIHAKSALAAGFDLSTVDGNLGYARHLYLQSGTTPWQSCVPLVTTPALDANNQLRIEMMIKLIDLLKQLLALKLAEG